MAGSRSNYINNRQIKQRERLNDIGDIPKPVDPKRREKAEKDLATWAETYALATDESAGLLLRPPSPKLRQYCKLLQNIIDGNGSIHVRLARGSGKTSLCAIALLYAVATGKIKFGVIFAASGTQAASVLSNIWLLLDASKPFAEDYPEIAYPIRKAMGIHQRYLTQTHKGERTDIQHTSKQIKLPTIRGAKSSGAVIVAQGAGSATRGLVKGAERPQFILLDDLGTRKNSESPTQVAKLEKWISGDVRGLTGSKLTRIVCTSTPIAKDDLSERLADSAQHPEFLNFEFPLVIKDPADEDLWTKYDTLYKQSVRSGDPNFTKATEFYEANRQAMDEGWEVLDPDAYDDRLERSAYQHARNLRITMGKEAFDAEYQLKTKSADNALTLSQKTVASRVNHVPRLVLPKECLKVLAGIDVNTNAGLSYVISGFGRHQTGSIIDYGRITGKNGRLVPKNASERETERIVSKALFDLIVKIHNTEIKTETGKTVRVGAIWVDRGYLSSTVDAVCELARKKGHPAYSCKGYDSRAFARQAKTIVSRADGVDLRSYNDNQFHGINADVSKEQVQLAFLALPLLPGSMSLFGDDPLVHWDFAEEITNETLAERIQGNDFVFYNWALKPGAPNHFLDAAGICIAAAKWYRFWTNDDLIESAAEGQSQSIRPVAKKAHRPKIVVRPR